MKPLSPAPYLAELVEELKRPWPDNRTVNIVCHGHSVPAGYFATPMVDTFNAYPYLLHRGLKERFPFAVVNVIVTAVGGEASAAGVERFEREVLCHRPDVVTLDYGLNDRSIGLTAAEAAWRAMIEKATARGIKVLLLTPTPDASALAPGPAEEWGALQQHAGQIRALADAYHVGLVDSLRAFLAYLQSSGDLTDLLSWPNHPNRKGHELVATELLRYFPIALAGDP